MTITTHDGFAIFPKRCNRCNRLFWLEPYDIYYKFHIEDGDFVLDLKNFLDDAMGGEED